MPNEAVTGAFVVSAANENAPVTAGAEPDTKLQISSSYLMSIATENVSECEALCLSF